MTHERIVFSSDLINKMMQGSYALPEDSQDTVLRRTADALIEAGVERVRYYHLANERIPDLPSHESIFYLTWLSYESGPDLGFSLPLEKASIYNSIRNNTRNPVLGMSKKGAKPADDWIDKIDLAGRTWVHVLVRDRERDVGLLAFDWLTGGLKILTPEEIAVLRLLGELLGFQLAATLSNIENRLQDQLLFAYSQSSRSEDSPLRTALMAFQEECDIASLSLFRYEWTTQRLIRQWIRVIGHDEQSSTFSHESFPLGKRLSGRAFQSDEYRHVLDFDAVRAHAPHLLSTESVQFHERVLGNVKSIMFGVVGAVEPKYLIRAINHGSRPSLPFLNEVDLLRQFSKDLSPYQDTESSRQRSQSIKSLQDLATADFPIEQLYEVAEIELRSIEHIDRIAAVMSRRRGNGNARPHLLWGVAPERQVERRNAFARDSTWSDIVKRRTNELIVLRRQDSRAFGAAARVTSRENADVAVLPVRFGETTGAIIFPVWGQAWTRSQKGNLVGGPSLEYLSQVGSMMAQWAEQAYIAGQSRGAQQALSLVGHELTEPLAAAKQVAERAIDLAKQAAGGSSDPDVVTIEALRHRLRRYIEILGSAVQLGHLVGRQVDKKIVGDRTRVPVLSLTNFAISRLNQELALPSIQVPSGTVRVMRPSGGRGLYLVCDRTLAEVAILNLLRNAVKYSAGGPWVSEIRTHIRTVQSQGSDYVEIAITNLGVEIPEMVRDLIFDAFTRFTDGQGDANRRGMGLGLYLTRQIALAHGGDVLLTQEVAPDRRLVDGKPLQRTTFSIRFRADLAEGSYVSEENK